MRIQLDFDEVGIKLIDDLKTQTGIRTHKDLFNNALTILSWAVHQRRNGRIIASLDEENENYRELQMPVLSSAAASGEQARIMESVARERKGSEQRIQEAIEKAEKAAAKTKTHSA